MKWIKKITMLFLAAITLSSCDQSFGCPDAEIKWIDLLQINDVQYQHSFPEPQDEPQNVRVEKGEPVGKTKYKMADHACSNHKMKNGDAAFIEKGTTVYEVKGYPSSLLVLAEDRVYVAEQNDKAKFVRDIYPIKNLVKNIHIESTNDGSRIHTFSATSTEEFIEEWLKLELVEYGQQKDVFDGEGIFLEIEFLNGVSFRQVYWPETNAFSVNAIGNDSIKSIITQEFSMVN